MSVNMASTIGRADPHATTPLRLLVSVSTGVLLVYSLASPAPVEASHLKPAGAHIWSIHYDFPTVSMAEYWCTDVHFSSFPLGDALTVINAAYTGNGSQDWHGLASGKINLSLALFGQCFDDPNWQSAFRLINQVMSNSWADYYCGTGYSCQYALYNYSCSGGTCHSGNSHQILRQSHMQTYPLQIHVVNHETGHAFGFDDPPPYYCSPTSVMHSAHYGCVDYYWPTQQDRNVLTYFVQDPSY